MFYVRKLFIPLMKKTYNHSKQNITNKTTSAKLKAKLKDVGSV